MRGRADAAKQMSISGRAEEHQSAWRQRMSIMSISSGGRRAKQTSSGGRRAKQEHPGHQQRREEGIMNIGSHSEHQQHHELSGWVSISRRTDLDAHRMSIGGQSQHACAESGRLAAAGVAGLGRSEAAPGVAK